MKRHLIIATLSGALASGGVLTGVISSHAQAATAPKAATTVIPCKIIYPPPIRWDAAQSAPSSASNVPVPFHCWRAPSSGILATKDSKGGGGPLGLAELRTALPTCHRAALCAIHFPPGIRRTIVSPYRFLIWRVTLPLVWRAVLSQAARPPEVLRYKS